MAYQSVASLWKTQTMPYIHPRGMCNPRILAQLTPTGTCCLSTVGSHCPLWGKSEVSGNQRHQEHPSVMINEVVGTRIRSPAPWWRRLRGTLNAAQWVDAPMVHSSDAQLDLLCWPPLLVFLPYYLPFMKLSSKLNPNLCFWGKGNYDSHQHLFTNLRKWGIMSCLESTLSLNFSSCHLGNMHNRECFIS